MMADTSRYSPVAVPLLPRGAQGIVYDFTRSTTTRERVRHVGGATSSSIAASWRREPSRTGAFAGVLATNQPHRPPHTIAIFEYLKRSGTSACGRKMGRDLSMARHPSTSKDESDSSR